MTTHWTERYIGRPYVPGGCWYLFRDVQAERFGRTFDVSIVPAELREIIREFESPSNRSGWERVTAPREGDGVLMSASFHPHHVGTYVEMPREGRLLHSLAGQGAACPPLSSLVHQTRFKVVGFYRPIGATA